ncbi:unnamed protein product, partial [Effrenium voratum]
MLEHGQRQMLLYLTQVVAAFALCGPQSPGSVSITMCLPCVAPEVDSCVYDISGCGFLPSGSICEVHCKAPYQGNSTIARCATNNTMVGRPLEWAPPNCSFDECPFPEILPAGYARDPQGNVFCAEGYRGVPRRRCRLQRGSCQLRTDVEGCERLASCRLQDDQECPRMDYQKCAELAPGQKCQVSCLPPFEGPGFEVQCSENNTVINGEPLRNAAEESSCTLPCPPPEPIPYGYTNVSGQWRCAEGYAGAAQHICVYDGAPFCKRRLDLKGCYALQPCADLQLPEEDFCEFNLSECRGVAPGQSCQLNCKEPFMDGGVPRFARCPDQNVNPGKQPVFTTLPRCLLSCPDPVTLPEGYRKVGSQWQCDDGWVGQVNRTCRHFANCSYQVLFEGCQRMVPCLPLVVDDELSCKMDVSECNLLAPGASCRIFCREPYAGPPGFATCVASNVDPQRLPLAQLPSCTTDCDFFPAGYMRTAEGWSCADGFGGVAVVERGDCGAPLSFRGCFPLQPCRAPEVDHCLLDASDCEQVPAGGQCLVRCPEGVYEPGFATATCPEGNTNPLQPLSFELECTPKCGEFDPVPEEYTREEGQWVCAEGFVGNASYSCGVFAEGENCTGIGNLTGCEALRPCAALDLQQYETQCSGVVTDPGETCSVECPEGLHGQHTDAFCPEDNVDPSQTPIVPAFPDCRLSCDAGVAGYEKTNEGWRCAPGYAGLARASCRPSWRCGAELHLDGCLPIVPCLRPTFGEDTCRFQARCPERMEPGSQCEIHCRAPYEGTSALAWCGAENTDPQGEAAWERPMCSFDQCPDPVTHSDDYAKDPGSPIGWRCADDKTGVAAVRCESVLVPVGHRSYPCEVQEGILSGCGLPQPCVPLEAMEDWDECMYDIAHCGEMVPNSFCEVKCRVPYVGSSTFARCPTFNIDPTTLVTWTPPTCVMDCPVPEPIPAGYVQQEDSWRCAEGYVGTAQSRCQLGNGTCAAVQVLSGCLRLEPCPLPQAHCSLNFSDCGEEVGEGTSCLVSCKRSYAGFLRQVTEDEEEENESNFSNFSFDVNDTNTSQNWSNASQPPLLSLQSMEAEPLIPSDGVVGVCPAGNTDPGHELLLPELICIFQDCVDPDVAPEGYEKVKEEWRCGEGFAGNVTTACGFRDDCVGELQLFGCVPVVDCAVPPMDRCRFAGCEGRLAPGQHCEILCQEPTQGEPGFAFCPGTNTALGAPAELELPDCESPCLYLEDVQAPASHIPANDSWTCAETFGGDATARCFVDTERNNCTASYVFEGCKPLTKCGGLSNPDTCRFIHSCIPGLQPEDTCEVRCKLPFLGDPVMGRCPADNTDPAQPPEIPEFPDCTPQCEEPVLAPSGYNRNGGNWTCADGYVGMAEASCGPDAACNMIFNLSGCVPKVPCRAPSLSGCEYNVSCPAELAPGESCEIHCQSPYSGNSTTASCDVENTASGEANYAVPNCSLVCSEPPVNLTEAYELTDQGWQCNSSGYLGTAVTTCTVDVSCNALLLITGCMPILPCLSPDPRSFDVCQYNFTGCDMLMPGASCNVSCADPYIGEMTNASCPDLNVDPLAQIIYERPNCSLLCPEPDPVPEGYMKSQTGWLCAEGFSGLASASCRTEKFFSAGEAICLTRTELAGCLPLQPCFFPASDVCDFDTSNCSQLRAGGTCQVHCQVPFLGASSVGRCPADNTVANRLVDVEMPSCMLDCPVSEIPEGYNISWGAARSDGLAVSTFGMDPISGRRARVERAGYFVCEDLYAGNLTASCSIDTNCQWRMDFEGCHPTVPCAALDLATPPCGLIADCAQVVPGRSCRVACNAPCTGEPSELSCPVGNTNPDQPLLGKMPDCLTECDFVPPGYRALARTWECADGYTGEAQVGCVPSGPGKVCDTEIQLEGCRELVSCGPGDFDPCHYDMSDCISVPRGESCTIRCRSPYLGPDFNASCPQLNTEVNDGLHWDAAVDQCRIPSCPDPNITNESIADEFNWVVQGDTYTCREGFVGMPARRCVGMGDECRAEAIIVGCEPLVPCKAPVVDFCRFEECGALAPGESCTAGCKFPFVGRSNNTASCPANNTNRSAAPQMELEDGCMLTCEDPPSAPLGYEKTGGVWQCASGFAGQATPVCFLDETDIVNETCSSFMNFSGCLPLQPCVSPKALDPCTYEENCGELAPGESCAVQCRFPPFNPEEMVENGLFCPQDNVEVGREAEIVELPTCQVFCPSPPPPPGYVKLHSLLSVDDNGTVVVNREPAYQCADGWTGLANHSCTINRTNCAVPVTLQGCSQIVPCKPIDPRSFDVCTYNITDCMAKSQDSVGPYTGLSPNSSCELSCRSPMRGDSTIASCVELNTDPTRRMDYELPTCGMYCPPPAVMPVGYVYLGPNSSEGQEYRCADGYAGLVQISCQQRGAYSSSTGTVECITISELTGCLPSQPCRAPPVDACRHAATECMGLAPGQTCQISCAAPLEGTAASFQCPADNVDAEQLVLGELPSCRFPFDCEEPFPLTAGYVKVNESYDCAEGYIGEASWDCFLGRFCAPLLVLSGCHQLVPCALPAEEDQLCGLNYSACSEIMGGHNCQVTCLEGFAAKNISKANGSEFDRENMSDASPSFTCPLENTDPERVIDYEPAICVFQACVDPHPVPPGYTKHNGSWICDEGFVGEVLEDCNTCNATLTISGCLPTVPCSVTSEARCMLDVSNCSSLGPGELCEIQCQAPYAGESTWGMCPSDNTDPSFEVNYTEPSCRLVCDTPDPVPDGYVWTSSGWDCAAGYTGHARFICEASSTGCEAISMLDGCNEAQPCAAPSFPRCAHVDSSQCGQLEPTEDCNLTCVSPFVGEATIASCPFDNQNTSSWPVHQMPRCVRPSCPEQIPPGYQKTLQGWRCARGYAGEVRQSCHAAEDCCESFLRLEGCRPVVGCKLPEHDACELDFSDCMNISSGEECEVRCRAPFTQLAAAGGAQCAAENTELGKLLDWESPICQILACERPAEPPAGYVYNGLAEECAPGYAGSALGRCLGGLEPHCTPRLKELSGCSPLVD